MGCVCSHVDDEEEEEHSHHSAGPKENRGCTDLVCLIIFVVYLAVVGYLAYQIQAVSDTERLLHGVDQHGHYCGRGRHQDLPYVYYYQLNEDIRVDPMLRHRTGICVRSNRTGRCPTAGEVVVDPEDPSNQYFVSLPTFNLAGRCVPYEQVKHQEGTPLCADPMCVRSPTGGPELDPSAADFDAKRVCGTRLDGTDEYWLMGAPDWYLEAGWQEEGYTQRWNATDGTRVLQQFSDWGNACAGNASCTSQCNVVVRRSTEVRMQHADEAVTLTMLSQYTGQAFRHAQIVWDNQRYILMIGLGMSIVMSFLIIALIAACAKTILYLLVIGLFAVLITVDYILFVQSGHLTGQTGGRVYNVLSDAFSMGSNLINSDSQNISMNMSAMNFSNEDIDGPVGQVLSANDNEQAQGIFFGAAIVVLIAIFLLAAIVCCLMKNFAMIVALLREASRVTREMPSLLLFPFLGTIGMFGTFGLLIYVVLSIMTVNYDSAEAVMHRILGPGAHVDEAEDFETMQRYAIWLAIFSYLWVYFWQIAVYKCTIAYTVSHWYFYRDDQERNIGTGLGSGGITNMIPCLPVVLALLAVLRFHMGSLAVGSFLLATVTLLRIILEYVAAQMQHEGGEENHAIGAILCCLRCALWCLDQCLQFITEYAYVNIAITGRNFCRSARDSFGLFAKYPAQVTLDKIVSNTLTMIACLLVPAMSVVVTSLLVEQWLVCAAATAFLSFMVTRIAVGVYDICITTLFMCAMRDKEHFGGKYMSDELREASGLGPAEDGDGPRRESKGVKTEVELT